MQWLPDVCCLIFWLWYFVMCIIWLLKINKTCRFWSLLPDRDWRATIKAWTGHTRILISFGVVPNLGPRHVASFQSVLGSPSTFGSSLPGLAGQRQNKQNFKLSQKKEKETKRKHNLFLNESFRSWKNVGLTLLLRFYFILLWSNIYNTKLVHPRTSSLKHWTH